MVIAAYTDGGRFSPRGATLGQPLTALVSPKLSFKSMAKQWMGKPARVLMAIPPAGHTYRSYYFAGSQRIAMRDQEADGSSELYYLLSDHLGSTSVTTDSNGNKIAELRYKPWGETRYTWGTTPTDYTYTGQRSEMDSIGLMYYNARWYDPALGRFAQADSIVPGMHPMAFDRYSYVQNNPIRYNDPTGHRLDENGAESGGCGIGGVCGLPYADTDLLIETVDDLADAPFFVQLAFGVVCEPVDWLLAYNDGFQWYDVAGMLPLIPGAVGDDIARGVFRVADGNLDNLVRALPSDKPVIIIGETMTRVDGLADDLARVGVDARTYNPRNFTSTPGNLSPLDIENNRAWARYWIQEKGATVIDMGIDPRKIERSPFYGVESRSIYQNWNYANVIKYTP